jgi:hypothetical protein
VPSESELRNRMREVGDVPGEIDVATVIRRARVRRLPRVLAVGGAACLAIAAIAVPVSVSMLGGAAGTTFVASDAGGGADKSAPEAETGQTDTMLRAAADQLNLCAAPLTVVPPAADGLQLSIAPIDAPADAVSIETIVTLVNNGSTAVRGTTPGSPSLTLSQDGVVVWHSNGPIPMIAVEVELAPGESLQYAASFQPVRCAADDDLSGEGFPPGLPQLGPGDYDISAAIDLTPLDGSAATLVTGTPTPVVLR